MNSELADQPVYLSSWLRASGVSVFTGGDNKPGIYKDSGGLNSSPHTCMASTFPIEASPLAFDRFLLCQCVPGSDWTQKWVRLTHGH